MRFDSNAARTAATVFTPATGALGLDVRSASVLRFFVRAHNPNTSVVPNGWQGLAPIVT